MTLKKLIGLRIKELRKAANLTQAQLAELVCVTDKHQSCIETGKNFPSAELIEKYAGIFGLSSVEVLRLNCDLSKDYMVEKISQKLLKLNYKDIKMLYRMFFD